jgi:uncharacterized membrane protein
MLGLNPKGCLAAFCHLMQVKFSIRPVGKLGGMTHASPPPQHSPNLTPDSSARRGRLNLPGVLPIDGKQPLFWLYLGLKDICHSPWLSLGHGLIIAICGGLITWLAHDRFWLLASAVSGFLVIAPVLATSLYAMSRAIERNEAVNLRLLFKTWTQWQTLQNNEPVSYWCLVRFGLLLALAGTGWVLTSSALITLLAPVPVHTPMDFIRHVVLSPDSYLFELWLALGGLMAAPVFASSVVAMPLLLDRKLNTLQAVLTSWKVVLTHPMPMVLWAFLIMGLSMMGVLSLFIGLIVIVPMLGHASWHAYRDLVDTHDVPERMPHLEAV